MRSLKTTVVAGVLTGALAYAPLQVEAATLVLPDSTSTVILHNNNTQQANVGVLSPFSDTQASGGMSATASTSLGPPPGVTAAASVTQAGQQATAQVFMEYWFGVSGPTGVQVPLILTASGAVTQAHASINSAQLYLGTPLSTQLVGSACGPSGANSCGSLSNQLSFSIAAPITITSNTLNNIQMTLFVVANTNVGGTSDSQSGFIDPIITFGPGFDASGFTLEFSAGIQNGPSAVPLPATLPLFATGLGALGLLGWRRKRKLA